MNLSNYKDGKRKCSCCGKWKELELNFRFYGQKRKRWTSKCNDCLKDKWRNDNRTYDEKRKKASHKYYHSKKRIENELKKGKKTEIKIVKCSCGAIEVRRNNVQKRRVKCKSCYRKNQTNSRWRKYYTPKKHQLECVICKTSFVSTNPIVKFCSDKCRAKNEKIKKKEARKEMGRHNHRSRARHYGVYYEPVNRAKVFKRDKWRCKECGVKVQNKKTNVDDEATLGHIVPLSKGGSHSYANVQCECRKCNTMKGDKVAGQQTTIFFGRGASI